MWKAIFSVRETIGQHVFKSGLCFWVRKFHWLFPHFDFLQIQFLKMPIDDDSDNEMMIKKDPGHIFF